MKREELWELLGEAPAEMIEESAVPLPKGTPSILRRVLPLAAAALLLCATAVAAVRYFGWQDVLNAKPEEITEHTEPLQVKVDAGDITFRVTEALADERVLYLLWEMQAPEAIFDERSTVEGWLDFGEASVDTGGGYIFSVEPPKEKSRLLCGYLTADWNDAMRGSTAHLRVSGLGHLERTGDTFISKIDMKALCESAVRTEDEVVSEWPLDYAMMVNGGKGGYEVYNTEGEVVRTIDMVCYENGKLYIYERYRDDVLEPDSPLKGVLCDSTGERVTNLGGMSSFYYSMDFYDVSEEELPNLQYIQPGRWQRVPDYDAEWEVSFDIPQTVEEKRAFLLANHIALWDVIASCDIAGSSDASIRNAVPNDLSPILETASVRQIFTNGGTAHRLYRKYIYPLTGREDVVLPSSSPANAARSLDALIDAWQIVREALETE